MCDFHTSLDRALEPHPHDYWAPEQAPPPGEGWQTIGYADEAWEPRDLRPMMDAINRSVVSIARARDYFTIDGTTAYDGVEVAIEWREPVIRPLEFTASIETIELLVGVGLVPLCERRIPAKGTE